MKKPLIIFNPPIVRSNTCKMEIYFPKAQDFSPKHVFQSVFSIASTTDFFIISKMGEGEMGLGNLEDVFFLPQSKNCSVHCWHGCHEVQYGYIRLPMRGPWSQKALETRWSRNIVIQKCKLFHKYCIMLQNLPDLWCQQWRWNYYRELLNTCEFLCPRWPEIICPFLIPLPMYIK